MIKWRYFFWQLYNRWFRFLECTADQNETTFTQIHARADTHIHNMPCVRHTLTYTLTYTYRQSIGRNGAMHNTYVCSVYGTVTSHTFYIHWYTCLKCSLCERNYTHKSLQQQFYHRNRHHHYYYQHPLLLPFILQLLHAFINYDATTMEWMR